MRIEPFLRPPEMTATVSFESSIARQYELKAIRQGDFQTLYKVITRFTTAKATLRAFKIIENKHPRITRVEKIDLGYTEVDLSWETEPDIGECA